MDNNIPWRDWIKDVATVRQAMNNRPRLSGLEDRDVLCLGLVLPPGNNRLAVSDTKGGLTSLLP